MKVLLLFLFLITLKLYFVKASKPWTDNNNDQEDLSPGKETITNKKSDKLGAKKNLILEPDDEIILKEDDVDGGIEDESKRDILILPEASPNLSTQQVLQTIQNALAQNDNQEANQQPIISVNVAGSRRDKSSGVVFDSSLTRNQEESTDILPSSLYETDTVNQFTDGAEPLSSNPAEAEPHTQYDEYLPEEYKSTQGLQDSEERLINKLVDNPPKGTSFKSFNHGMNGKQKHVASIKNIPSSQLQNTHYNDIIDGILLDKALDTRLNQKKHKSEHCSSVPLSHIDNCSNSTDAHCKDDDLDTFRKNGLFEHQQFREVHHTTPVELNDKLNEGAQEYADKLAYADKLSYSDPKDRPGQGENIAVKCSDDGSMLTAKDAVAYWYHKICQDTTSLRSYSPEIGQFSQIIWKDTNFVGLGRSTRNKGGLTCTYIVARYSPQATKNGFLDNVPRGDFDDDKSCPIICANNTGRSIQENPSSPAMEPASESAIVPTTSISTDVTAEKNLEQASESMFDKMKLVTDTSRNETDTRMNTSPPDGTRIVHNGSVLVPSLKPVNNSPGTISGQARSNTERVANHVNITDSDKYPTHIIHLADFEGRELNNGTTGFAFRLQNSSIEGRKDRDRSLAEERKQSQLNFLQLHLFQNKQKQEKQQLYLANKTNKIVKSRENQNQTMPALTMSFENKKNMSSLKPDRLRQQQIVKQPSSGKNHHGVLNSSGFSENIWNKDDSNFFPTDHPNFVGKDETNISSSGSGNVNFQNSSNPKTSMVQNTLNTSNLTRLKNFTKPKHFNSSYVTSNPKNSSNVKNFTSSLKPDLNNSSSWNNRASGGSDARDTPFTSKYFGSDSSQSSPGNSSNPTYYDPTIESNSSIPENINSTIVQLNIGSSQRDNTSNPEISMHENSNFQNPTISYNQETPEKLIGTTSSKFQNSVTSTSPTMGQHGMATPSVVGKSRSSNTNPDIMIFINKQNNDAGDGKSQIQNDDSSPPMMEVANIRGSHGENLTIVQNQLPDSNGLFTREMLQSLFTELTKAHDRTDGNHVQPAFLQLIPYNELEDFRHGMLSEHNTYRMLHHSPPLLIDSKLNKEAQTYAAYVAKHASVAHSPLSSRPNTGESVAELCTKEGVLPTPEHVVKKWYSEICSPGYDFTRRDKQPGTGHFTQLIWKDTERLGIGLAVANHADGDSCSYVVARYKNAGNYLDRFEENVENGGFEKRNCVSEDETKSSIKYYRKSSVHSTKPKQGKSLEEINKEFASKYLSNGENYIRDGKIYHFGYPKNFSFTPSKLWLENYQVKAGIENMDNTRINIDAFVSANINNNPIRTHSPTVKQLPPKFRVRMDRGEISSDYSGESFQSRKKNKLLYMVNNGKKKHSVAMAATNKEKLPKTSLSTDDQNFLMLRHRRSSPYVGNEDHTKTATFKKVIKRSNIVTTSERANTSESTTKTKNNSFNNDPLTDIMATDTAADVMAIDAASDIMAANAGADETPRDTSSDIMAADRVVGTSVNKKSTFPDLTGANALEAFFNNQPFTQSSGKTAGANTKRDLVHHTKKSSMQHNVLDDVETKDFNKEGVEKELDDILDETIDATKKSQTQNAAKNKLKKSHKPSKNTGRTYTTNQKVNSKDSIHVKSSPRKHHLTLDFSKQEYIDNNNDLSHLGSKVNNTIVPKSPVNYAKTNHAAFTINRHFKQSAGRKLLLNQSATNYFHQNQSATHIKHINKSNVNSSGFNQSDISSVHLNQSAVSRPHLNQSRSREEKKERKTSLKRHHKPKHSTANHKNNEKHRSHKNQKDSAVVVNLFKVYSNRSNNNNGSNNNSNINNNISNYNINNSSSKNTTLETMKVLVSKTNDEDDLVEFLSSIVHKINKINRKTRQNQKKFDDEINKFATLNKAVFNPAFSAPTISGPLYSKHSSLPTNNLLNRLEELTKNLKISKDQNNTFEKIIKADMTSYIHKLSKSVLKNSVTNTQKRRLNQLIGEIKYTHSSRNTSEKTVPPLVRTNRNMREYIKGMVHNGTSQKHSKKEAVQEELIEPFIIQGESDSIDEFSINEGSVDEGPIEESSGNVEDGLFGTADTGKTVTGAKTSGEIAGVIKASAGATTPKNAVGATEVAASNKAHEKAKEVSKAEVESSTGKSTVAKTRIGNFKFGRNVKHHQNVAKVGSKKSDVLGTESETQEGDDNYLSDVVSDNLKERRHGKQLVTGDKKTTRSDGNSITGNPEFDQNNHAIHSVHLERSDSDHESEVKNHAASKLLLQSAADLPDSEKPNVESDHESEVNNRAASKLLLQSAADLPDLEKPNVESDHGSEVNNHAASKLLLKSAANFPNLEKSNSEVNNQAASELIIKAAANSPNLESSDSYSKEDKRIEDFGSAATHLMLEVAGGSSNGNDHSSNHDDSRQFGSSNPNVGLSPNTESHPQESSHEKPTISTNQGEESLGQVEGPQMNEGEHFVKLQEDKNNEENPVKAHGATQANSHKPSVATFESSPSPVNENERNKQNFDADHGKHKENKPAINDKYYKGVHETTDNKQNQSDEKSDKEKFDFKEKEDSQNSEDNNIKNNNSEKQRYNSKEKSEKEKFNFKEKEDSQNSGVNNNNNNNNNSAKQRYNSKEKSEKEKSDFKEKEDSQNSEASNIKNNDSEKQRYNFKEKSEKEKFNFKEKEDSQNSEASNIKNNDSEKQGYNSKEKSEKEKFDFKEKEDFQNSEASSSNNNNNNNNNNNSEMQRYNSKENGGKEKFDFKEKEDSQNSEASNINNSGNSEKQRYNSKENGGKEKFDFKEKEDSQNSEASNINNSGNSEKQRYNSKENGGKEKFDFKEKEDSQNSEASSNNNSGNSEKQGYNSKEKNEKEKFNFKEKEDSQNSEPTSSNNNDDSEKQEYNSKEKSEKEQDEGRKNKNENSENEQQTNEPVDLRLKYKQVKEEKEKEERGEAADMENEKNHQQQQDDMKYKNKKKPQQKYEEEEEEEENRKSKSEEDFKFSNQANQDRNNDKESVKEFKVDKNTQEFSNYDGNERKGTEKQNYDSSNQEHNHSFSSNTETLKSDGKINEYKNEKINEDSDNIQNKYSSNDNQNNNSSNNYNNNYNDNGNHNMKLQNNEEHAQSAEEKQGKIKNAENNIPNEQSNNSNKFHQEDQNPESIKEENNEQNSKSEEKNSNSKFQNGMNYDNKEKEEEEDEKEKSKFEIKQQNYKQKNNENNFMSSEEKGKVDKVNKYKEDDQKNNNSPNNEIGNETSKQQRNDHEDENKKERKEKNESQFDGNSHSSNELVNDSNNEMGQKNNSKFHGNSDKDSDDENADQEKTKDNSTFDGKKQEPQKENYKNNNNNFNEEKVKSDSKFESEQEEGENTESGKQGDKESRPEKENESNKISPIKNKKSKDENKENENTENSNKYYAQDEQLKESHKQDDNEQSPGESGKNSAQSPSEPDKNSSQSQGDPGESNKNGDQSSSESEKNGAQSAGEPGKNDAQKPDKEKGLTLPGSFVSEIISKVSHKAHEMGLDKPLSHAEPPTAVSATETLAPINTPMEELPKTPNELEHSALIAHNKFRKIHNSPMLAFSPSLSRDAQKYAEELISLHGGALVESPPKSRPDQGENLFMDCDARGLDRNGEDATNKWYEEICQQGYDFDVEPTVYATTQHFTQLIWKSSLSLGLGKVTTKRNHMTCTIIVARYKPAGNVIGQFKGNLEEGVFAGSVCEALKDGGHHAATIHPNEPFNHHPQQYVSQETPAPVAPPITISSTGTNNNHNNYYSSHPSMLNTGGASQNILSTSDEPTLDLEQITEGGHAITTTPMSTDGPYPMHDTEDVDIGVLDHVHNTLPAKFLTNTSTDLSDLFVEVVKKKAISKYVQKKPKTIKGDKKSITISGKHNGKHNDNGTSIAKLTSARSSSELTDDENNVSFFAAPTKKSKFGEVKSKHQESDKEGKFGDVEVGENENDFKNAQRIVDHHPVHINENIKPIHIWDSTTSSNLKQTAATAKSAEITDSTSMYQDDDASSQSDKVYGNAITEEVYSKTSKQNDNLAAALESQNLGEKAIKNYGEQASNIEDLTDGVPSNILQDISKINNSPPGIKYDVGEDKKFDHLVNFENLDSEEQRKHPTNQVFHKVLPVAKIGKNEGHMIQQNRQHTSQEISTDKIKLKEFMVKHLSQTPTKQATSNEQGPLMNGKTYQTSMANSGKTNAYKGIPFSENTSTSTSVSSKDPSAVSANGNVNGTTKPDQDGRDIDLKILTVSGIGADSVKNQHSSEHIQTSHGQEEIKNQNKGKNEQHQNGENFNVKETSKIKESEKLKGENSGKPEQGNLESQKNGENKQMNGSNGTNAKSDNHNSNDIATKIEENDSKAEQQQKQQDDNTDQNNTVNTPAKANNNPAVSNSTRNEDTEKIKSRNGKQEKTKETERNDQQPEKVTPVNSSRTNETEHGSKDKEEKLDPGTKVQGAKERNEKEDEKKINESVKAKEDDKQPEENLSSATEYLDGMLSTFEMANETPGEGNRDKNNNEPSKEEAKQSKEDVKPSPANPKPSLEEAKPSKEDTKTSTDNPQISAEEVKPLKEDTKTAPENPNPPAENPKPSAENAKLAKEDAKISSEEKKQPKEDTKSPEEVKPFKEGVKPSENAKLSNEDSKESTEKVKPSAEESKMSKEDAKPSAEESKISKEDAKAPIDEVKPSDGNPSEQQGNLTEKPTPSKNKQVSATGHLNRLPVSKRPQVSIEKVPVNPAPVDHENENDNFVSVNDHEGKLAMGLHQPAHSLHHPISPVHTPNAWLKLPLANTQPTPQQAQNILYNAEKPHTTSNTPIHNTSTATEPLEVPINGEGSLPMKPMLSKPVGTATSPLKQMHPAGIHPMEDSHQPEHLPGNVVEQPGKIPNLSGPSIGIEPLTQPLVSRPDDPTHAGMLPAPSTVTEKPHDELSDNIDHGISVAPVAENSGNLEMTGLGLLPTFRFASFGSPVILHIGATGFFEDPAAFLRIGLSIHNEFRKIHDAPPLQIDPMLTMQAFQHAQILSSAGFLKHPNVPMPDYGENLLLGCYDGEYDISAEEAVLRWYAEVCNPGYNFLNKLTINSGTSHFSQVVWNGSKKLGMAKVTRMQNGMRCTYVVARYGPGGNVNTGFPKNVKAGSFKEKKVCADVIKRLVGFESRNMDKVKMIEKEKQVARIEFLEKMKEGEAHVQKEIAEHDAKISSRPTNPLTEPPIMNSEYHPDGGPLNKEAAGHLDKGGLQHGDDPQETLIGGESVPDHIALNLEANPSPSLESNTKEPSVTGVFDLLQNNLKEPSVTGAASPHEPSASIDNLFSDSLNEHPDHVITNQQTAVQSMKIPIEKSRESHKAHRGHKSQSDAFKIPKMAARPEEVRVIDAPNNPASILPPEAIDILSENKISAADVPNTPGVSSEYTNPSNYAAELLKSDEKNAVVELDLPTQNPAVTETEGINDNVLENIKEQKSANEDAADGVSETTLPSEKVTTMNVKLNDDENSAVNIDTSSGESAGSFSSQSLHTNNDGRMSSSVNSGEHTSFSTETSQNHNHGNHRHNKNVPTSLEKEIEEVTSVLDSNDLSPDVKEERLAKAEEKLIKDSNLHNVDVNSLLKDEDEELSEEINNLQDHKNVELRKGRHNADTDSHFTTDNGKDEQNDETESYIRQKEERDDIEEEGSLFSTIKQDVSKSPTKKSSGVGSPQKSLISSTVEQYDGINTEDEAMIGEILAKSHSSVPSSKFDDALQSRPFVAEGGSNTRGKITKKRKTVAKKFTQNKKKNNCNKTNNDDGACVKIKATNNKLVPDPTEKHRHNDDKNKHEKETEETDDEDKSESENENTNVSEHLRENEGESSKSRQKLRESYQHDEQIKSLKQTLRNALTTKNLKIKNKSLVLKTQLMASNRNNTKSSSKEATPTSHNTNIALPKNKQTKLTTTTHDSAVQKQSRSYFTPTSNRSINDVSVFEMNALKAHNAYRHTHGARSLRLNHKLSDEATVYAKQIAKLGTLRHSGTEDGENIATVCRDNNILMTGPDASEIWYREVCDPGYDFVSAQPGNAGHFSQVVWKASKEFGIGRAAEMHNGLLCTYIVARYRPAGNFLGEFSDNVERGRFTASRCVNYARKDQISRNPLMIMPSIYIPPPMYKRSGIPTIREARSGTPKLREPRSVNDTKEDFVDNTKHNVSNSNTDRHPVNVPTLIAANTERRPVNVPTLIAPNTDRRPVTNIVNYSAATSTSNRLKGHHHKRHHHRKNRLNHYRHHHRHKRHRHHHHHHQGNHHYNHRNLLSNPYNTTSTTIKMVVSNKEKIAQQPNPNIHIQHQPYNSFVNKIDTQEITSALPPVILSVVKNQTLVVGGSVKSQILSAASASASASTSTKALEINSIKRTTTNNRTTKQLDNQGNGSLRNFEKQDYNKTATTPASSNLLLTGINLLPPEHVLLPLEHAVPHDSNLQRNAISNTSNASVHNATTTGEQYGTISNKSHGTENASLIFGKNNEKHFSPFLHNATTYNDTDEYINKTAVYITLEQHRNRTANETAPLVPNVVPIISMENRRNGSLHKDVVNSISVYQKLNRKTGQAMNNASQPAVPEQLNNGSVSTPVSVSNTPSVNNTLSYNNTDRQPMKRLIENTGKEKIENAQNIASNDLSSKNTNNTALRKLNYTAVMSSQKFNANATGNYTKKILSKENPSVDLLKATVNSSTSSHHDRQSTNPSVKIPALQSDDLERNIEAILEDPLSLPELKNQVLSRSYNKTESGKLRSLIERDDYLNKINEMIESRLSHKSAVIVPQSLADRVKCAKTGNLNCTFIMNGDEKTNLLENTQNNNNIATKTKAANLINMNTRKKGTVMSLNSGIINPGNTKASITQQLTKNLISGKDNLALGKLNSNRQESSKDLPLNPEQETILSTTNRITEHFLPSKDQTDKLTSIDNLDAVLKLAKIGTIALQLAKRKEMERMWIAQRIREEDPVGNMESRNKQLVKSPLTVANPLVKQFYPTSPNPTESAIIRSIPLVTEDPLHSQDALFPQTRGAGSLSAQQPKLPSPSQNSKIIDEVVIQFGEDVAMPTQANSVKRTGSKFASFENNENYSNNQEFVESSLNTHNTYRFVHEVDPLQLDKQLIERAQVRATDLALHQSLETAKRNNDEDGENIALVCKDSSNIDQLTGPDATRIWYNQVCNPEYVFNVDRTQENTEKFMQVVWKDTKRFGIGRSTFQKGGKFCTVVVARYSPPVNKVNARSNVIQGVFDHGSYCNGLGRSSIPAVETENTEKAIRSLSQNTQDFRLEALNLQNEYRSIHQAPSMELDDTMCIQAEQYATQMAKSGTAKRNSMMEDGENVMKSCNINDVEVSADEAVRKWYNEVCNPGYSFLRGDVPGGVSSFTQMMWKPTKRFGIGKATSHEDGMFCTYIVGLYREKGNSNNEYYTNVLKGDFDFAYCDSLGKQHGMSYERFQRHKIENITAPTTTPTSKLQHTNAVMSNNTTPNTFNSRHGTVRNFIHLRSSMENKNIMDQNKEKSRIDKSHEAPNNGNSNNKTTRQTVDTVKTKQDQLTENIKVSPKGLVVSIDVINSASDTKSKRNRIPFKIRKWKKNKKSKSTKKKKVMIDNLMQLNDFVMKVNSSKKKSNQKSKQKYNIRKKNKYKKKKS